MLNIKWNVCSFGQLVQNWDNPDFNGKSNNVAGPTVTDKDDVV